MNWRAWYTEGRVYTSDETDWLKLPSDGLVWVTVYRDTGKTHYNGGDWYWIEGDRVRYVPSREWGVDEPRPDVACLSCVKRGAGVPDEEFRKIAIEAWGSEWHRHISRPTPLQPST